MPVPTDADRIDGLTELYEAYDAAKAAKAKDPTRETIDAANAAGDALNEARAFWRGVRAAVREGMEADAVAIAEQVAAELDAGVDPDGKGR